MTQLYDTINAHGEWPPVPAAYTLRGSELVEHVLFYGLTQDEVERMDAGQITVLRVSGLL